MLLAWPGRAVAHEPIFGIGPRVIWKDGFGFEIAYGRERSGPFDTSSLEYELLYGITPDLAVTVAVPQVLSRRTVAGAGAGIGDVGVRLKWRFFRRDVRGGVYHAAVIAGLELPTAATAPVRLGSGTRDALLGLAAGFEGRRWLWFASARYKRNGRTDAGVDVGDATLLDAAIGVRPVRTAYRKPDTVVMAELNYRSGDPWRSGSAVVPNTGGKVLFLSAGVWFTYRNHAFKPGLQVPVYTSLNGIQERPDWRLVLAYEIHLDGVLGR